LRLQLEAGERHGTRVDVLKCRGSRPVEPAWIPQPYSTPGNEHMPALQASDVIAQPAIGKLQLLASTAIN